MPAMRTDVVIIGAGLAGLAAARAVRKGGFDVVVLEARDRVGGGLGSRVRGTVDAPAAEVQRHDQ